MPILTNPKWEAFAQHRAKGKSLVEAYEHAGYKPNESHASRLVSKGMVADRIAELQSKAAARSVTTIEDISRQLDEDRDFARDHEQAGPAITATMGKAKLLGFLVDKVEVKHSFSDLTDEELQGEIASLLSEVKGVPKTAH